MRRGIRRRVLLATAATFGVGILLLLVGFNLLVRSQLSRDADQVLRARAAAQRANVLVTRHGLKVREPAGDSFLDGQTWVFSQTRPLEQPFTSPELQAQAEALSRMRGTGRGREFGDTRLLSTAISVRGHRVGTIVAAVSLAPYERSQHTAFVASLLFGAALLVLMLVFTRRTVSVALRPVRQMTEQAASWSERDLHRRFALGEPKDELTALAATLDGLLGRLDASLQHEQRFSAEIAHELRTPLARQRAEVELAMKTGRSADIEAALVAVLRDIDQMTVTINTLVSAAQAEADPRRNLSDAAKIAGAAAEAMGAAAADRQIQLDVIAPIRRVEVDADQDLAVQTLLPVIENAVRHAKSSTRIACRHVGDHVCFDITDDGPGLFAEETESVFDPGARGDASVGRGSGLGLALSRRLARSAGGDVRGHPGPGGRFEVALPAS